MSPWRIAALTVVSVFALTGCGGPADRAVTRDGLWSVETVDLPDGRTVTCVVRSGNGVSCDWESIR